MSWAPQVKADATDKWSGNQLRFATREEAMVQVRNLEARWTSVTDIRVQETTDPVTHIWHRTRGLLPIEKAARFRVIVEQLVADEKLLRAEDRQTKPAGRYLYAAGDPQQALDRFHQEIPIACLDDFKIEVEPYREAG